MNMENNLQAEAKENTYNRKDFEKFAQHVLENCSVKKFSSGKEMLDIYFERNYIATVPLTINREGLDYQSVKLTDEEITDIAFDYGYGIDINSDKISNAEHIAYCAGLKKGGEKMWLKLSPHLKDSELQKENEEK